MNNIFQCRDTHWLQKVGTAKGALPALHWDTIFFSIYKEAILAKFKDTLQLYCRFIDNIVGIWLVDTNPAEDHPKWTAFTSLMKYYYSLEWIFKESLKR